MNATQVQTLAREIAVSLFGENQVDRIDTRRDADADGDPIWRLVVVLQAPEKVEPTVLSKFQLELLRQIDLDDPYPIVSFRSARDDRGLASEAA